MPTVLRTLVLATGLAVGGAAGSAQADTAAANFSPSSNTGTWTFGSTATLGGAFTPFTVSGSSGGIDRWVSNTNPDYTQLPGAGHNGTPNSITNGTVTIGAGQLSLHPGVFGEYSIARFTAPVAGTYSFSASFMGLDFVGRPSGTGTTTDVHLQVNGVSWWGSNVNGFGIPSTVSSGVYNIFLAAGGTIDAAVGYGSGPNPDLFYDSTGVDFNVRLVPLPAGVWAGGATMLAVAGAGIVRRRRHV